VNGYGCNLRGAMAKPKPDMIEGPEAFRRFRDATKAILAVPHSEIKKRIEEHRALAAKNPNKRGPKRKT
jgi:hypothetical protein